MKSDKADLMIHVMAAVMFLSAFTHMLGLIDDAKLMRADVFGTAVLLAVCARIRRNTN